MAEDETATTATTAELAELAEPTPATGALQGAVAATPEATATATATASAAFVDEVRQRVARANYGVSASVSITLLDRGDYGLLLFEADDHQEALRAASAALETTPNDDGRVWRFGGSGPDLETGRYRAVVRVSGPSAQTALTNQSAGSDSSVTPE